MNNPNDGMVKNIWSSMGKPFRNNLIVLSNIYNYNIKRKPNPFLEMKKLVEKENPVIIDGGANNGGTITTLKQYFPNSTIFAFEPLRNLGLEKNTKNFSNVYIEHLALGDENKIVEFNETNYPDTSSIFVHRNANNLEHLRVKDRIKVDMVTLDNWAEKQHVPEIDIIKLDLQGYELNALRGAKKLLSSCVKLVYSECSLKEFYINQPLFLDVEKFMTTIGFEVHKIYSEDNKEDIGFIDVLFKKRV